MEYRYCHLDNGFRIIHLPTDGEVEYFGILVNAGSRDELPGKEGLAHFVEHTIFKGTSKRKSWHILNRMERVGGELNAYTTKEETAVYSIFPYGNLKRAAELISDIVRNSDFPETEIKKEKSVVEEEILSYLDTPADDIYDKFDSYIFANSSLAHNILGNAESLNRFDSHDCSFWLNSKFTPSRTVLFYMGKTAPEKVFKILNEEFGTFSRPDTYPVRTSPAENRHFDLSIILPAIHQNHNLSGIRIPGIFSEIRPVYALISNILGGPGMNSLLNIEMREKLGLVYSIETSLVSYTDCGLLTIYYGCDQKEQHRCDEVMKRTLDRFVRNGLTTNKLKAAKRQFIGQMLLSYDNHEQNILSSARSMLHKNKVYSINDNIALIESITLDALMEVAMMLEYDSFSRLTLRGS